MSKRWGWVYDMRGKLSGSEKGGFGHKSYKVNRG